MANDDQIEEYERIRERADKLHSDLLEQLQVSVLHLDLVPCEFKSGDGAVHEFQKYELAEVVKHHSCFKYHGGGDHSSEFALPGSLRDAQVIDYFADNELKLAHLSLSHDCFGHDIIAVAADAVLVILEVFVSGIF